MDFRRTKRGMEDVGQIQGGKKFMSYGQKNYLCYLFLKQDKNYSLYSPKYCTFKYGRIELFFNLN